jgi:ADP-ribose pyrophosphatase YjhB (NUDIX family)
MEAELKKAVVTGVLVKNADGEFLLVKKANNTGPYAGTYLTPGGGVETGEAVDDAVLRELYEETGIKIKNLQRVFFDDDVTENWQGIKRHYIMLLYTAEYESGEVHQTEGNDDSFEDVSWFSIEEIKKLPLSPPLEKLLNHIGVISG